MRPFGLHRRHLDVNRTEFSIEFQPSWQDFLMGLLHTYYLFMSYLSIILYVKNSQMAISVRNYIYIQYTTICASCVVACFSK